MHIENNINSQVEKLKLASNGQLNKSRFFSSLTGLQTIKTINIKDLTPNESIQSQPIHTN